MTQTEPRARRADSVRNRAKIMDAARAQIASQGPDVGMTEIASAAGVAVGTLYRHFPNKADLIAAVIGEFVTQVADQADVARANHADGAPAIDELVTFLRYVLDASATNHAVKAAATTLGAHPDNLDDEKRAGAALSTLLDAAKADGHLRADLTVADFYLLINHAPTEQPTEQLHRWLDLVLNGLRTASPPRRPRR